MTTYDEQTSEARREAEQRADEVMYSLRQEILDGKFERGELDEAITESGFRMTAVTITTEGSEIELVVFINGRYTTGADEIVEQFQLQWKYDHFKPSFFEDFENNEEECYHPSYRSEDGDVAAFIKSESFQVE